MPAPYPLGAGLCTACASISTGALIPRSFIGDMLADGTLPIGDPRRVRRILDLCTGSGCLAILAALALPHATIDAVDLSAGALALARRNVATHRLGDRIALHRGDLFAPVGKQRYDLIISNPPYVDAGGMAKLPQEYRHEPRLALAAGKDGLDLVRRIIDEAPHHLSRNGNLLCEVGRGRQPAVPSRAPDRVPRVRPCGSTPSRARAKCSGFRGRDSRDRGPPGPPHSVRRYPPGRSTRAPGRCG
jgi:ribosomal protein L3 glutamine methyltransferase